MFFVIYFLPLNVYVLDEVVGLDFMDVFTMDLEAVEDCRQLGSEGLVSEEYVILEEEDGTSSWVDMKMLGFSPEVYLDGQIYIYIYILKQFRYWLNVTEYYIFPQFMDWVRRRPSLGGLVTQKVAIFLCWQCWILLLQFSR